MRQIPLFITSLFDVEPIEVKLLNEQSRKSASEILTTRTANRHR